MNSASQDFAHHLSVLRERMLHPTAYETAVSYFLEEFAGDAAFVRASDGFRPGPWKWAAACALISPNLAGPKLEKNLRVSVLFEVPRSS